MNQLEIIQMTKLETKIFDTTRNEVKLQVVDQQNNPHLSFLIHGNSNSYNSYMSFDVENCEFNI